MDRDDFAQEAPGWDGGAVYEQIRRGRLRTVVQGRSRLIPASALFDYVELLKREARGAS